jgi:hypothetical protein
MLMFPGPILVLVSMGLPVSVCLKLTIFSIPMKVNIVSLSFSITRNYFFALSMAQVLLLFLFFVWKAGKLTHIHSNIQFSLVLFSLSAKDTRKIANINSIHKASIWLHTLELALYPIPLPC